MRGQAINYEFLAKEILARLSKIADDFYPDHERENGLALQEMREALQELDSWGCDQICEPPQPHNTKQPEE